MSDSTTQAKQARETLARALGALQSDPGVPPQLLAVAEPVAQAMGALHAIERTGGLSTAQTARDHVRQALGMLQAVQSNHPAVAQAMESVAGSLGLIFGLVKLAEQAGNAPTAAAQPYQQPVGQPAFQQQQPPPQQPAFQQPAPQQAWQQPAQQPAPPQQPVPQQHQPAPQQAVAAPQPAAARPVAAPQPAAAPAGPGLTAAPGPPAPAGASRFEAALGTNSPTNFYKGLSGNDVVEHGGIFVATYAKVPKVGAPVALRIALPGGYEFEAVGVVAWTRDQRGGGGEEMQPGFGARFTQIAPEARQLIYRYVRNREPLFHDDF